MVQCRTDTRPEVELVQKLAREGGAFDAVICSHWAQGGAGAQDLAKAVDRACQQPSNFKFLYDVNVSIYLEHVSVKGPMQWVQPKKLLN